MTFTYYLPTRIAFGAGSAEKVGEEAAALGKKALIVVGGGGSMKRTGVLDKVTASLAEHGVDAAVFDRIQSNPITSGVNEGARVARDEACDLVIGLGGGSPIDSAKCIAFMARSEGTYWDYVDGGSGGGKAPADALPILAIPTTAGTGTEADPFAVITNPESNEKIGIGFEVTFPKVSLVDPELMLTVPRNQTAYTGIDAFYHALESYLNVKHQPVSDLLALQAIELINDCLPTAYEDGEDLEARSKLAWASTAAGMCETLSGCIGNHSLEHPLSGHYPDLPHGAGLAALGPSFFEHVLPDATDRLAQVAEVMGQPTGGRSVEDRARQTIAAISTLQAKVGLGNVSLKRLGVKEHLIPKLAEDAVTTMGRLLKVTPGKPGKQEVIEIYRHAFDSHGAD